MCVATIKPAALDPTDKNAVTGVGAPWYTSGTQIWNGTAATLNASPTRISVNASKTAASLPSSVLRAVPTLSRWVSPVSPKIQVIP